MVCWMGKCKSYQAVYWKIMGNFLCCWTLLCLATQKFQRHLGGILELYRHDSVVFEIFVKGCVIYLLDGCVCFCLAFDIYSEKKNYFHFSDSDWRRIFRIKWHFIWRKNIGHKIFHFGIKRKINDGSRKKPMESIKIRRFFVFLLSRV